MPSHLPTELLHFAMHKYIFYVRTHFEPKALNLDYGRCIVKYNYLAISHLILLAFYCMDHSHPLHRENINIYTLANEHSIKHSLHTRYIHRSRSLSSSYVQTF